MAQNTEHGDGYLHGPQPNLDRVCLLLLEQWTHAAVLPKSIGKCLSVKQLMGSA